MPWIKSYFPTMPVCFARTHAWIAPLLDVLSIVTDEGDIDANRSTAQRPSTDHVFMHGRAHLTEDLADLPVCLSPQV